MTTIGTRTTMETPPPARHATTRLAIWTLFLAIVATFASLVPATPALADDGGAMPTPQSGEPAGSIPRAKRTIMLYACGSNLEEDSGMASINLRQILNSNFGNGEDVRFVVMTGGSYRWHLERDYLVFPDDVEVPGDAVQIGNPLFDEEVIPVDDPKSEISGPYNQIWEARSTGAAENPGKLVLLDGDGFTNGRADQTEEWMSDPQTLKSFIDYSVQNYPADKYDLILWDHGGGPSDGFALDVRRPQRGTTTMTFPRIIDALKNNAVTNRGDDDPANDATFDFVNFDACLMGSAEISLAIADYTDYYIASPKEIPGYGEVYTGWLNKLGQDPSASAYDIGKTIVDDMIGFYDAGYDDGTRQEATMAVVDTKALLQSNFLNALSTIGTTLKDQLVSGRFYDEVRSLKGSIAYDGTQYFDLGNLVAHLGVSLWELNASDVNDSTTVDKTNAYTAAAKTVLDVLSDPRIIYAANTSGVTKESQFFMNDAGETTGGTLSSSGMHLYFPTYGNLQMVIEYNDEAIAPVVAMMPDDGRAEFLADYVDMLYDFNFVVETNKAVSELVNSGVPRQEVDYERVKAYWQTPYVPDIPEFADFSHWNNYMVPVFTKLGGSSEAGEARFKPWLDEVIRQQAAEAISAENVSAQTLVSKAGEGRKVQIANTRRRVVSSVKMNVVAELPFARQYIADHMDDLDYLLESGEANLSLGSVYATADAGSDSPEKDTGDFLRDYVNWLGTTTTTSWNLNPRENKWHAIKDAQGNLHVAEVDEDSDSITVPMMRMRGSDSDSELLLLGFKDDKLTQIYLHDDEGNARIIRASDLKSELSLMPIIYISGWSNSVLLPISESGFTITPDTVGDIKLVYTDVNNISDIGDVDGDGKCFDYQYVVTDIYGNEIDITSQVENPTSTLVDIKLAEVKSVEYTGEAVSPKLVYGGNELVEGQDFTWTRNAGNDPVVLPGTYGISVVGLGSYTGLSITEFTVEPTAEDYVAAIEGETRIRAMLQKVNMDALQAGDADARMAARAALAAYDELTDAQKTIIEKPLLIALLSVAQKVGGAAAPLFFDVDESVAHASDIEWLALNGISTGWELEDGGREFRPYADVARADMAAFLYRLASKWGLVDEGWEPQGASPFADVDEDVAHCQEILWLAENGISTGWKLEDGTAEFRPYASVARADMAAFLHRLQLLREGIFADADGPSFTDVDEGTAHSSDILWLAQAGISEGWKHEDGTAEFRPYAFVARADMAAFLHRLDALSQHEPSPGENELEPGQSE